MLQGIPFTWCQKEAHETEDHLQGATLRRQHERDDFGNSKDGLNK